jgi:D-galacturonate reductase
MIPSNNITHHSFVKRTKESTIPLDKNNTSNMTAVTTAVNVLMIGTGEYTTGYTGNTTNTSDKSAGVVALAMFDFRSRGKVQRIGMCGVNGTKFPAIRRHMQAKLGVYRDLLDISTCETFPADHVVDAEAYKTAIRSFQAGDVAIVFTPDDTHYDICMECVQAGLHVLVTKPIVQNLHHHTALSAAADQHKVLVAVEVHKRLDPFYADARDRARAELGDFQYLYAYMSQPKHQLDTFAAWAGKSSDISYYLVRAAAPTVFFICFPWKTHTRESIFSRKTIHF